jgi:hypothetical protein
MPALLHALVLPSELRRCLGCGRDRYLCGQQASKQRSGQDFPFVRFHARFLLFCRLLPTVEMLCTAFTVGCPPHACRAQVLLRLGPLIGQQASIVN